MVDEANAGQPQQTILPITGDFPAPSFPTVYADSISSVQPANQTTKFYLARIEPSLKAENTSLLQPFAQVVMPTFAFVYSTAFLVRMVEKMIDGGNVEKSAWDEALKAHGVTIKL